MKETAEPQLSKASENDACLPKVNSGATRINCVPIDDVSEDERTRIEYSKEEIGSRSGAVKSVLWLIGFYRRAISPHLPPSCRFTPTCSQYTYQAIARFGLRRGVWLGVKRLARCRPFGPCGHDPIPDLEDFGQTISGSLK